MYYYIFDPPTGAKEYERTAQIKELLGSLGIAGEMTQPQPGKTAEDLVHSAISKRYSTIIAVGDMDLINQVARAVEPYEVVFGIIPTIIHPDIAELIGTSEWKPAAEQLKRRRWQAVRMAVINDVVFFLTPARINLTFSTSYTLKSPDFSMSSIGGEIRITPRQEESEGASLQVEIIAEERRQSTTFLSNFFRRKGDFPRNSQFTIPELHLVTNPVADVSIAGSILSQTPLTCRISNRPIRLIVSKVTPVS